MLLNEDCLVAMQKLIDDGVQVDSVVTDPPYHLQSIVDRFKNTSPEDDTYTSEKVRNRSDGFSRLAASGFMGQEWDGGDIAFRKETWELALKLLKPGGHLLAFSASRNYHRMAVAVEDAGFEIRDQLMWLYGSGFPKSLNIGKVIDKKLGNVREKIPDKYAPRRNKNVSKFNNIYGGIKDKHDFVTKGNTEWEGWGTALKPAHEPIVMARKPLSEKSIADNILKHGTGGINIDGSRVEGGRFPANIMHDGSEEVVSGFPEANSARIGNPNNPKRGGNSEPLWGMSDGRETHDYRDSGSSARFFYCPKVPKSERGEDNTHPTVKPQELMKYLCRLVTPNGGTVLDPFMGSGSTGMAAKDEGFEFIGIEREKEYFEIAEKRISNYVPLTEFFE
jgi:site-specific DNA-methyltransferase (adenine-specific)